MIQDIIAEAKEHMKKSIEHLDQELSHVRSGRAHPSLVDSIPVEYYGSEVPLKQIASISIPEARTIAIQPFDKNALADIEKAIHKSDLSVNPNNNGQTIHLQLPHLTEEQRKDLVKIVHKQSEETRIAVRNIRRDANAKLDRAQKDGSSEDEVKRAHDEIQKITDTHIQQIDEHAKNKEKEVMTV